MINPQPDKQYGGVLPRQSKAVPAFTVPNTPQPSRRLAAGALAALMGVTGTANAELIEYSFTSVQGEKRTVPASQNYVNPTGQIAFALSAGVDRRVRVSILDSKDKVISTKTGKLLGAEDRITAAGARYYGEVLSLAAPTAGSYTIKAEVMSADGKNSVQADSYPLTIDTTPPQIGDFVTFGMNWGGVPAGSVWKIGAGAVDAVGLQAKGVTDNDDVSKVLLEVHNQDGIKVKSHTMNFVRDQGTASIKVSSGKVFPKSDLDEVFNLKLIVEDRAGNTTVHNQKAMYDNTGNPPTRPFAVFDPDEKGSPAKAGLEGFVPYVSGMEVKTNPIKLAWKIPKSNWHAYRDGGINLTNHVGETTTALVDSTDVYIVTTAPFGIKNHNYIRWNNYGSWGMTDTGDSSSLDYSLKLAPGVPDSPVLVDVEYNYSDIGWSSYNRPVLQHSVLPLTINGIRVSVQPRPYAQTARHMGECVVPAMGTSCTIAYKNTLQRGTTGYLHEVVNIYNADKTLSSDPRWAEVDWNDLHYPKLTYSYDEGQKVLTAFIEQPGRGSYFDRLRLRSVWLEDASKKKLPVPGVKVSEAGVYYEYKFDLKILPEGGYNLVLAAAENHGPESRIPLFFFGADTTPPELSINIKNGQTIKSLDEFEIGLYDAIDPEPKIQSIRLVGGPANDEVKLAWRQINSSLYKLEYPIMFPSLAAGEEYQLEVIAEDAHKNKVSSVTTFVFDPPTIGLAEGMDGKIYIPAVTAEFRRKNGNAIIATEPVMLGDGEVVSGTYDVIVSSRSDSAQPIVINGRIIQPGDAATIAAQHDFSTTGGRIDIPVRAAVNGGTGKVNILVTTSAPNSPVALAEINLWNADVNLSSSTWEYRQVIDPIEIKALPAAGTVCRLTMSEPLAKKADPISDPVCLIEWTRIPDEAEIASIKNGEGGDYVVGVRGQAVRLGEQPVDYTVYMFSGDNKIQMGTGGRPINVLSAEGSVSYKPAKDISTVLRKVELVELKLTQDDGARCRLTLSAEDAIRNGQSSSALTRTCLLEWLAYPGAMQQMSTSEPYLRGYMDDAGTETIEWRISTFSKSGIRVSLAQQSHDSEVVNPPSPTIAVDSKYGLDDGSGTYAVPMDITSLGLARFEGEPADLFVGIYHDGAELEGEVFMSGVVREKNRVNRVLDAFHDKGLYGETELKLKTHYDLLPDVGTEQLLNVVSVPSSGVSPVVDFEGREVLDTENLAVTVSMYDRRMYDRTYREEYGQWSVVVYQRLNSSMSEDSMLPLTEAVLTDEHGKAEFDIDMSQARGSGARLVAVATLVHDIPGYVRTVESTPVYTTVLFGGAVEGEAVTRKFSGESIYKARFQFVPDRDNLRAARALGATKWFMSSDDGATWEEFEKTDRPLWSYDFPKGIYLIKAESENRHSGETFTSEEVEIYVYDKAGLDVQGPRRLMVEDTAHFKVVPRVHGDLRPSEDFNYEWSTDKGVTWVPGTDEYTVTQDEPGTFQLRVRVKEIDAPAEDLKAWTTVRINPRFYPIRGPKIGLRVPRKMEVGKSYEITASARSRVSDLQGEIKGEFILPDGTRHAGSELTYIPTAEDEAVGRVPIVYEAWFTGFEDRGGMDSRSTNARIWEYVWPSFEIKSLGTVRFAPTRVTLNAVQSVPTALEKPEYVWKLPDAAEVSRDVGKRVEFVMTKGGTHEIELTVSDARGHQTTTAITLELEDAPAWEIDQEIKYSNEAMREPLTVSYRPSFSGGHPLDRVAKKRFYLNGELFKESGFTAKQELPAGTHVLSVEMESRYGQLVTDQIEVEVVPNQPPVCSVEVVDMDTKWRVVPDCEDPDGTVRRLNWNVNGALSSGSKYKTFIKSRIREETTIEVIAVDDSGDGSEPQRVTLYPEPGEEQGGDNSGPVEDAEVPEDQDD